MLLSTDCSAGVDAAGPACPSAIWACSELLPEGSDIAGSRLGGSCRPGSIWGPELVAACGGSSWCGATTGAAGAPSIACMGTCSWLLQGSSSALDPTTPRSRAAAAESSGLQQGQAASTARCLICTTLYTQKPITCGMQAEPVVQMQLYGRARSRHPPELAAFCPFGSDCRCWTACPTLGLGMRLTKSSPSTLKSRLPPLGMPTASAIRDWLSELSVDL